MIALSELTAVLQQAWTHATAGNVPTQFPGTPLDATRLSKWYEFWITQTNEQPQRHGGQARLTVLVDVHCYSRRDEKRQVFEMADHVRSALGQKVFPLIPGGGADISCGVLRTQEAVVRDLTRESDIEPRLPLQHLVVSLTAQAEHLPS